MIHFGDCNSKQMPARVRAIQILYSYFAFIISYNNNQAIPSQVKYMSTYHDVPLFQLACSARSFSARDMASNADWSFVPKKNRTR
jgi:hypothetical protein